MFSARVGLLLFLAVVIGMAQSSTAPQFGPASYYPLAVGDCCLTYPATVDINGDGRLDVVAVSSLQVISVLFGDGTGKLGNRVDTMLPQVDIESFDIGDLNSDGCPDLAIAQGNGPVLVYVGDCKGGFTHRASLTTLNGSMPVGPIAIRDVNRDGKLDLILGGGPSSHVSVFIGHGDGTFSSELQYGRGGTNPSFYSLTMAVADFNNDGVLDIAVANQTPPGIAILFGNGDGTFRTPAILSSGTGSPIVLSAADINGDGVADLLFVPVDPNGPNGPLCTSNCRGNKISVYLADGIGGFTLLPPFVMGFGNLPLDVKIADLNGDGVPDLAVAQQAFLSNRTVNGWDVFLGRGDGTFTSASEYQAPGACGPNGYACTYPAGPFALGDLNGDRKPDLVFADGLGTLGVDLNITSVPAITTTSLPSGTIGNSYLQTLMASGGTSPYVWSVVSGALPTGITVSPAGVISGTPTTIGTSNFTVQVSDGASAKATQTFTIAITNGILTITTPSSLLPGASGLAYSQTLSATGGATPYSWSLVSGGLPSSLTLSAAGAITGTPTVAGAYSFIVTVTDSASATATQTFNLTVVLAGTLSRSGTISHIAAGSSWTTVITLVNTSSAAVPLTVALHNDDGSALTLPVTTTQQGISQKNTTAFVNATMNPNTTLLISMGGQVASTVVGWADVTSSGSLGGYAIFRYTPPTGSPSEGTVPLQTQFPSTITLPYDNTAGFVMGVAVANLSTSSASVTATMWDDIGNQLGTQNLTIAGSGHTSFVLPTQIPLTAGRRGIVKFQSAGGIAGLGLRFSPFGTFTSVPTM
jgi:hypothetical protein